MIETVMIFMLGALFAALLAIALLPALWRRAVRLTRAELEATLPLTPGEIAADKDQVRALHAVEVRRLESRVEALAGEVQQAKTVIGEKIAEIQRDRAEIEEKTRHIAEIEETLARRQETILMLEDTVATLTRERDNLATNLSANRISAQAIDQELIGQRQTAAQSQAREAELEVHAARLSGRIAELQREAKAIQDESAGRANEIRTMARRAQEDAERIASIERRLVAAETLAEERATALTQLQAERQQQIEDRGQLARERDHEKIGRDALSGEVSGLKRKIAELEKSLSQSRTHGAGVVKDLTRTIETLREDREKADSEASALRLDKARLETELIRLRRKLAEQAAEQEKMAASL